MTKPENSVALGPARLLHTMLRVSDLDQSLNFYCDILGMRVLRREDYPEGRFTLVFVGYGPEENHTVVELTHNWDHQEYEHGNRFGHLALGVANVEQACDALWNRGVNILRPAGPMKFTSDGGARDRIAFIADPDGYQIELVERVALSQVTAVAPKSELEPA